MFRALYYQGLNVLIVPQPSRIIEPAAREARRVMKARGMERAGVGVGRRARDGGLGGLEPSHGSASTLLNINTRKAAKRPE